MKRLTLIDKAALIRRTPLFASLDLDLLLPIADKLGLVTNEAGEMVFLADEDATRMYFIVKGEIEIRNPQHGHIAHLKAGDFFGDESLFSDKPRAYEAYSTTKTQLLTLSRTHLFTIISECPSVATGFLQVYTTAMTFRHPHSSKDLL